MDCVQSRSRGRSIATEGPTSGLGSLSSALSLVQSAIITVWKSLPVTRKTSRRRLGVTNSTISKHIVTSV